jgi:carboxypeptidase Q
VVLVDWTAVVSAVTHRVAVRELRASYALFRDAGAAAVLLPDNRLKNNVLDWTDVDSRAEVLALPVAQVGTEDGELLFRLLDQRPVRIAFGFQDKVTGPATTSNVIAEIPGQKRDEWILLGAHLDAWDFGTGAQDDGTGVVMILEAARTIAALGVRPKRSIRFVLWGAEEPGLLGSRAYVRTHAAELPNCVAVLNTDHGAGHPQGWRVYRQDLLQSMIPISRSLLRDLGGDRLSDEMGFDSDSESFFTAGVPTLELMVDTTGYSDFAHKQGDTFDKVDPIFFKLDAAIVAVTAYTIAESPHPIARHLRKEEVKELLKNLN